MKLTKSNSKEGKCATPIPTPPKSTTGSLSRRSSPRSGHSDKGSPLLSSVKASSSPVMKKRKTVPVHEDVMLLCPICDDVCTCAAAVIGTADWSSAAPSSTTVSPIIIKDSGKNNKARAKKSSAARRTLSKAEKAAVAREKLLDMKADTVAQLVLSEYYFEGSEGDEDELSRGGEFDFDLDSSVFGTEDEDAELEAIIFDLSSATDGDAEDLELTRQRMRELVVSKVNRVLNNESVEFGSDAWHLFDPAAPLGLPIPPTPPPVETSEDDIEATRLARLTPQVLAAISVAAKTLTAATQHYTACPDMPFVRGDSSKQVAFVFERPQQQTSSACYALDELIDTSALHGSSPPTGSPMVQPAQMRRWDKIPVSSFRKRRLSVPRNVLPPNAIKQPPPHQDLDHADLLHMDSSDIFVVLPDTFCVEQTAIAPQRQRRATLPTWLDSNQAIYQEEDLFDAASAYWPFSPSDEDLHWLGEHFRTRLA